MSENQLECDRQSLLHQAAIRLLQDDERSLTTISMKLQIPYPWLHKLIKGEIRDPSVNRISYLVEQLSQKIIVLK